jgi:hypothetical protein
MRISQLGLALLTLSFCLLPAFVQATPDLAGREFQNGPPIKPPPINQTDEWSMMAGFPQVMGISNFSPMEGPILVDIDGDGDLEVFAGSSNGQLYGWHHNGTAVSGFPVQCGSGRLQTSPSVGDIDGDGNLEVAVCTAIGLSSTSGEVWAFHHNGTTVAGWPQQTSHGMGVNSVTLYDLDNDGACEVIVGADRLYAWEGNGTPLTGFPVVFQGSQYGTCSASSIGDIDGDGQPEIVLEGWNYLNAFNMNGTPVTGFPYALSGSFAFSYSAPSLVDINNDGAVEIFCGTHQSPGSTGQLLGVRGNGTDLPGFPQAIGGWTYSTPAIGDLDNDGQVEVALLCNAGLLYAFNGNGTPVTGWPINFGYYNCEAALAMADIDGDGQMEVCFGTNNGNPGSYLCYRGNGMPHPDFPFTTAAATLPTCSAIADADGNGRLEIAHHVSNGTVYLWTSPNNAATAARPWPQPHHDVQHTGNYHFGGATHDIIVDLNPIGAPITIPSGGGSFSYMLTIINREVNPVPCQFWIMLRIPNGSTVGPIIGPISHTIAGHDTLHFTRSQAIPGRAPAGNYIYAGYVGQYPGNVWDNDSFPFIKAGGVDGEIGSDWLSCLNNEADLPEGYLVASVSPNPFNPTTTIRFTLPDAALVTLEVFDINGRRVGVGLAPTRLQPGEHSVAFDGYDLPSGVYLYKLETSESGATPTMLTGKMVLMK